MFYHYQLNLFHLYFSFCFHYSPGYNHFHQWVHWPVYNQGWKRTGMHEFYHCEIEPLCWSKLVLVSGYANVLCWIEFAFVWTRDRLFFSDVSAKKRNTIFRIIIYFTKIYYSIIAKYYLVFFKSEKSIIYPSFQDGKITRTWHWLFF